MIVRRKLLYVCLLVLTGLVVLACGTLAGADGDNQSPGVGQISGEVVNTSQYEGSGNQTFTQNFIVHQMENSEPLYCIVLNSQGPAGYAISQQCWFGKDLSTNLAMWIR